jgi:hypothetical protein
MPAAAYAGAHTYATAYAGAAAAPFFGPRFPPMRRVSKKAGRLLPSQDRRCGRNVNRTSFSPCGEK